MTGGVQTVPREFSWRTAGQVLLGMGLAAAGYLAARFLGFWLLYLYYLVSIAAMSWVDLQERRIPNRIVYPVILVAAGAGIVRPGWPTSLLGGLAMVVFLLLPMWIRGKRQAGAGEVKLGLLTGLVLGISWALYWAVIVAFGSASVVGLVGILLKRWDRHSLLPLGPFLALGLITGMVIQAL